MESRPGRGPKHNAPERNGLAKLTTSASTLIWPRLDHDKAGITTGGYKTNPQTRKDKKERKSPAEKPESPTFRVEALVVQGFTPLANFNPDHSVPGYSLDMAKAEPGRSAFSARRATCSERRWAAPLLENRGGHRTRSTEQI